MVRLVLKMNIECQFQVLISYIVSSLLRVVLSVQLVDCRFIVRLCQWCEVYLLVIMLLLVRMLLIFSLVSLCSNVSCQVVWFSVEVSMFRFDSVRQVRISGWCFQWLVQGVMNSELVVMLKRLVLSSRLILVLLRFYLVVIEDVVKVIISMLKLLIRLSMMYIVIVSYWNGCIGLLLRVWCKFWFMGGFF